MMGFAVDTASIPLAKAGRESRAGISLGCSHLDGVGDMIRQGEEDFIPFPVLENQDFYEISQYLMPSLKKQKT
ncbi:MAG: hypothetical protein ACREA0_23370 [bacterium]